MSSKLIFWGRPTKNEVKVELEKGRVLQIGDDRNTAR